MKTLEKAKEIFIDYLKKQKRTTEIELIKKDENIFIKNYKFYKDYIYMRKLMVKYARENKQLFYFFCKKYTIGRSNNTSQRIIKSTQPRINYIINIILDQHIKGYVKTGGIGTSHALNIFNKICYKMNFKGCCDHKISQYLYETIN